MRKFRCRASVAALALLTSGGAFTAEQTATLNEIGVDGEGGAAGTTALTGAAHGLLVAPVLHDLSQQGAHGMCVRAQGACGHASIPAKATL